MNIKKNLKNNIPLKQVKL